jgi:diketogulonate reductase-like aldo/keto reductase
LISRNEIYICIKSESVGTNWKVEINPLWQQNKLREFCEANGIVLTAYAPLGTRGTIWGSNRVMENEVLREIATAKGKSVAQVCSYSEL